MFHMIVVDDDVNAVNNITKDFPWEESGFTVLASFQDGESALSWLKTNSVDLILCDIKMPRMNGIELARRLHDAHRHEKIIFISGYKDFEYARKALEYGVSRYCVKPVTYREMLKTIQEVRDELLTGTNAAEHEFPLSTLESNKDAVPERNIADVQLEKIRRYILQHYADVTLSSLAEYLEMNTSYLSRYFRNKTGKKLFDFITEVRLNVALEILKTDTTLNVTEVGERVGYTNPISFSRSFKKQFGVPPSEFRRDFGTTEGVK